MALLGAATVDEMESMALGHYVVVHPLDDRPETKVDTESLGRMHMAWTVRLCFLSLRACLLVMCGLVAYQIIRMAGFLK